MKTAEELVRDFFLVSRMPESLEMAKAALLEGRKQGMTAAAEICAVRADYGGVSGATARAIRSDILAALNQLKEGA